MHTIWTITSGYILTAIIFILSFIYVYQDTGALLSSISAAFLTAALVFVSFIMLRWLVQVFTK